MSDERASGARRQRVAQIREGVEIVGYPSAPIEHTWGRATCAPRHLYRYVPFPIRHFPWEDPPTTHQRLDEAHDRAALAKLTKIFRSGLAVYWIDWRDDKAFCERFTFTVKRPADPSTSTLDFEGELASEGRLLADGRREIFVAAVGVEGTAIYLQGGSTSYVQPDGTRESTGGRSGVDPVQVVDVTDESIQ